MAEKTTKTSKADRADEGVLGSLSTTRPNRLSRRARAGDDAPPAPADNGAPAAKAPPTATKPKAKRATPAQAKPKAKPAATATARPATTPKAGPATAGKTGAERVATHRPRAVSAGVPELHEPAMKADAARESAADEVTAKPQSGAELAATVVKAAGELAQIGFTVGGQILKRALPRRD